MKSLVRLLAPLAAGIVLAGCASSNDPSFLDNPDVSSSLSLPEGRGSKSSPATVARFHVGESVTVTFSGLPEGTILQPHQEPIKEDGTITLPYIGPVQAAGKTAGEL